MKRKLIRQGIGGMTIYLPKPWVDAHHLGNGAEVDIEPLENDLIISAQPQDCRRSTEITLRGMTESSIRTLITNTYRSGYDTITVSFENEQQFQILRHVVKTRLVGFEITKREEGRCVVEIITEPAADQLETILRKFLYSISDLLETAQRRLENPNAALDFEEIEERIQRYDNFCRRIIIKSTLRMPKSEMLWTFLALLLHAQREVYHLLRLPAAKACKEIKAMFAEAISLYELIKRAYVERNVSLLSEVHDRHQELLYKRGYALLERSRGKETIALFHILAAMRIFYQANSPLAGYLV
jgi:phosphate uptake regulator